MSVTPGRWTRATDFSEMFEFVDVRRLGLGTLEQLEAAFEEGRVPCNVNLQRVVRPWDIGSGKPNYRVTLFRTLTGYVVKQCTHHVTMDGVCGPSLNNHILNQYDK